MAPTDTVHICRDCLPKYDMRPMERIDLGICIECDLKEVGYVYNVALVKKKEPHGDVAER